LRQPVKYRRLDYPVGRVTTQAKDRKSKPARRICIRLALHILREHCAAGQHVLQKFFRLVARCGIFAASAAAAQSALYDAKEA
jgi:hypothetical protein